MSRAQQSLPTGKRRTPRFRSEPRRSSNAGTGPASSARFWRLLTPEPRDAAQPRSEVGPASQPASPAGVSLLYSHQILMVTGVAVHIAVRRIPVIEDDTHHWNTVQLQPSHSRLRGLSIGVISPN